MKQARALASVIAAMVSFGFENAKDSVWNWIAKQYSANDATSLLKEAQELIKPIQSLGLILFLFLFVLTPLLGAFVGLMTLIVPVAIVMVALAVYARSSFVVSTRNCTRRSRRNV